MKPNGISMSIVEGELRLTANHISKVEDMIWDAVEEAINTGWTPEQFKAEAASAWEERLREDAKHAVNVLSK
jgi:hypothetical protein